jgi:putative aldouronate transport system permease protein
LFIAAIAGINPELYEVAVVDGAGRFSRIWHITLPGISPTIVMLLILRVGALVSIGFERPYLLSNTLVREFSDVISVYVYRVGLEASNFSLATAVGLFQSVIGMILLISTNAIANKINDSGIF